MLEDHLTSVEKKIDDLLASVEQDEQLPTNTHSASGTSKDGATVEQMVNGTVKVREDNTVIPPKTPDGDELPIMGATEAST